MAEPNRPTAALPATSRVSTLGISLGRIAGVRVQADWSLLIVFALVLSGLGTGVFPAWHPDWAPATTWTVATAAAVLFFASVLVHELSHALVARAHDVPVHRITLFMFGGMAHLEAEPPSPKSEFLIAVVGPLTSLAIGFGATFAGAALAGDVAAGAAGDSNAFREAVSRVGPVATLLLWLGPINFVLGVFNLVPGFPLDGGRVLRAILWWATGDLLRATRWASFAGQGVAWSLMGLGVWSLLSNQALQGLWLVLIGWFLNGAARNSYQQVTTKHVLRDVPVSRVMWTQPLRVSPDLTIEQFVREYLMASDQGTFAVETDGVLLGLLTLDAIRKVPEAEWAVVRVRDLMIPRDKLATLPPSASADRALDELGRRDVDYVSVLDGSHLHGIVRQRDLVRWLAFHERGSHA